MWPPHLPHRLPLRTPSTRWRTSIISRGLVPSLEIGVERRGQMVFDRAYGLGSLAPAIMGDVSTDYQIASLTKAFTAAAVLLLVQDG